LPAVREQTNEQDENARLIDELMASLRQSHEDYARLASEYERLVLAKGTA
jgi:hypothetical protein